MNNKLGISIEDWNEVQAIEMGEFETLELGGHEVTIIGAGLYTSDITGNTSLKVGVDISGNDKQKGYFRKQYDENTAQDKKWPTGAVRYLSLKKESLAYTKGFITSLEKSNSNFKFDTSKGWEQIKGLKCCGVFGLEEYQNDKGETKTGIKLVQFRSLDKLSEVKIPKVKLLDGTFVDYEEYKNKNRNGEELKKDFGDIVEISDDFLD